MSLVSGKYIKDEPFICIRHLDMLMIKKWGFFDEWKRWWILSLLIKCERWFNHYDTSLGQEKSDSLTGINTLDFWTPCRCCIHWAMGTYVELRRSFIWVRMTLTVTSMVMGPIPVRDSDFSCPRLVSCWSMHLSHVSFFCFCFFVLYFCCYCCCCCCFFQKIILLQNI